MENYANDAGREFGWDDEIQNDSPDLSLIHIGFTCIRGRKDCCAHSSRASASASTGRLCVRAGTK